MIKKLISLLLLGGVIALSFSQLAHAAWPLLKQEDLQRFTQTFPDMYRQYKEMGLDIDFKKGNISGDQKLKRDKAVQKILKDNGWNFMFWPKLNAIVKGYSVVKYDQVNSEHGANIDEFMKKLADSPWLTPEQKTKMKADYAKTRKGLAAEAKRQKALVHEKDLNLIRNFIAPLDVVLQEIGKINGKQFGQGWQQPTSNDGPTAIGGSKPPTTPEAPLAVAQLPDQIQETSSDSDPNTPSESDSNAESSDFGDTELDVQYEVNNYFLSYTAWHGGKTLDDKYTFGQKDEEVLKCVLRPYSHPSQSLVCTAMFRGAAFLGGKASRTIGIHVQGDRKHQHGFKRNKKVYRFNNRKVQIGNDYGPDYTGDFTGQFVHSLPDQRGVAQNMSRHDDNNQASECQFILELINEETAVLGKFKCDRLWTNSIPVPREVGPMRVEGRFYMPLTKVVPK